MKQFILKELMPDGLPPRLRQRVQIVERERHRKVRRDDLQMSTVDDGEGCAQNLVAAHDFVDAPLQDGYVARRRYPQRIKYIETRYVGQRSLEIAQMFLRDRSWHDSIFSGRADEGRGSSRRQAGLNHLFEMVRHLRNRRCLEKSRGLELNFRKVVDVAENVCGEERVSTRRKEVIVDTNLLELEDLRPTLGQQFLEGRLWRDEGRRQSSTGRKTQFGRQADTLHFAGRAFWNFTDDEDLARDLEVGDAADGELTYVFRRREAVGAQHDRRGDVLPQRGMGDGKGDRLCHRWMFQEYFVDFLGGDFLPTAIDDFPYAASEKKVPVVVEEPEIPCLEPIACKRGRGRHGVAIVARHDARAAHYDLSGLTVGQQSPSFVHNRDLQTDWHAGRSGLAPGRREGIARDRRGSGFRHGIVLDHGRVEGRLQFRQDVRWQRSGSGTDET